ncbi:MAG: agmatine deiminase family protein, partial [Bacteroidaceae bacterium]|nr:agmatine deiminase family protein [Bacteroidaceae bacterium]
GTLLVTSGCLLNPNRNATYSKEQVEARLCEELGAERVLWLDHGNLAGDDTDGHIDTLARLCPKDTIVYVKAEDKADEHYEELSRMEAQLQTFCTMDDRPYRLLPLPLPAAIYDEEGERLPATYANYLVVNGAVLYPTYGQKENDEQAAQVLAQAFQGYDIVGVDCTPLIYQHGSLHCATMQYPRGVVASPADEQAE